MIKSTIKFKILMGILLFNTVIMFSIYVINSNKSIPIKKIDVSIPLNSTSLDYISEKINEYNIQHPDIVLAQSILESNVHKIDIIKNNNLFGMKSAWVRTTVALNPKTYEYAKYSSIDSSILDYKLWQLQYANNLTRSQYLLKLKQIYASDTMYIKKLLIIIKNDEKFRNFKQTRKHSINSP